MVKGRIQQLKGTVKRYKVLVENFGYLSVLQLFATLIPLIIYPYLVRVLGSELYGFVIFAQSITLFFSQFIDYGFNISAVKDISENRTNKEKISEIVSSVIIIKFILWFFSFSILLILIYYIPRLSKDPLLFLFSFTLTFNQLLFPQWFFQGIEKMKYITIVNIFSKLFFLTLIFIIIKEKDDYLFVPLLQGIGALFAGGISIYITIKKEGVRYKLQSFKVLKKYLKNGFAMFGFRLSGVIKTRSNQLLLGFLSTYSVVAYYDLALRISSIFSTIFNNYTIVFFPIIAKNKNILLGKKALKLSSVFSILVYIILALILKPVIMWWNPEFLPTVILFWIIGAFIPIYAIASFLGNSILVSHGYQKQHFYSTAWTTLVYLGIVIVLYVTKNVTIYSLGISIVLAQLLSTIHKYYYCKKYGLL